MEKIKSLRSLPLYQHTFIWMWLSCYRFELMNLWICSGYSCAVKSAAFTLIQNEVIVNWWAIPRIFYSRNQFEIQRTIIRSNDDECPLWNNIFMIFLLISFWLNWWKKRRNENNRPRRNCFCARRHLPFAVHHSPYKIILTKNIPVPIRKDDFLISVQIMILRYLIYIR